MCSVYFNDSEIRVLSAIKSLRKGEGIIVCDDPERENEGDLIFAADFLSEAQVAQMIRDCSGIICLCLTPEKVEALGLEMMTEKNSSRFGTNFTVSIEAREGVTTGVSAADRLATVKAACAAKAKKSDLAIPGHIFPLKSNPDGVLGRAGHTEATVDMMRLAGLSPFGVLCEITNPDGTMARGRDIENYAALHKLPVVGVGDIIKVRKKYGYNFYIA